MARTVDGRQRPSGTTRSLRQADGGEVVVAGEVVIDDGGDFAVQKLGLSPERRGEGGVGGVAPGGDPGQGGARGEARRVEDLAAGSPAGFDDGVEVHG